MFCFYKAYFILFTATQAEEKPGLFEKIWKYILNNITVIVHIGTGDNINKLCMDRTI